MLKVYFSTHFLRFANKLWTNFTCIVFLCVKLQPELTKTVEMRAKTVWRVNIWSFLMHISKKLTFRHSTDGIKSRNKNEQLYNVTYNYQMSKCQWNFATLLNFHRPSWPFEICKHFLTSPFEHTVLVTSSQLSFIPISSIIHSISTNFYEETITL